LTIVEVASWIVLMLFKTPRPSGACSDTRESVVFLQLSARVFLPVPTLTCSRLEPLFTGVSSFHVFGSAWTYQCVSAGASNWKFASVNRLKSSSELTTNGQSFFAIVVLIDDIRGWINVSGLPRGSWNWRFCSPNWCIGRVRLTCKLLPPIEPQGAFSEKAKSSL
jgi:hypothetical protein